MYWSFRSTLEPWRPPDLGLMNTSRGQEPSGGVIWKEMGGARASRLSFSSFFSSEVAAIEIGRDIEVGRDCWKRMRVFIEVENIIVDLKIVAALLSFMRAILSQ